MNTILQQRIEEAAKKYCQDKNYILPDDTELSLEALTAIDAYIEAAKSILKNQWISVDEALPPKEDNDSSITVLVHCQKGWYGIDYYRYKYGEWLNNRNSVTHWMQIPSLKGGEK